MKRKLAKKRKAKSKKNKKNYRVSGVREDAKQRKKFDRGGRIEAYTWGEV